MRLEVLGLDVLANAKPWLVHRGRFLDVSFLLEVGDAPYLVRIHQGRVEAVDKGPFVMPRWTFTPSLGTSANLIVLFWPAQIASERSLPTLSASMSKAAVNSMSRMW